MSTAVSLTTRKVYGVERVCAAWGIARSSFYSARSWAHTAPAGRSKPGPKPALDDATLLALIRADLAASPFTGEGHRKVHARLHFVAGHRVGRGRVLRLMREHHLLSPHRTSTAQAKTHDGRIGTDSPNVLWATDGTKIWTEEEGWVWVFTVLEHWNAELLGFHVCKRGDRYAAYEPVSQALQRIFGSTQAEVARGVHLRHDHGSQYLTDYFQGCSRFHGFTPSLALVGEPQTNGVVERFNRTLKEQIIHGHTYKNCTQLQAALRTFADLYNHQWRLEKLRYRTPVETRQAYQQSSHQAA